MSGSRQAPARPPRFCAAAAAGRRPRRSSSTSSTIEEELIRNGFLRNRESRPSMVRNLRSLFQRAQCTAQELRTLHGVVTAFAGPRERKAPEEMAEPAGGPSGETA